MDVFLLLVLFSYTEGRQFCEKNQMPLEIGEWKSHFKHLDSAVVENKPVTISEGQIYVYDNYFPGYTIRYIHVDNLAVSTCGASATVKNGGIGSSSVLLVLHAGANQEIRSVVDIWGSKNAGDIKKTITGDQMKSVNDFKNVRSLYLFKDLRAVNHNKGF